MEIDKLGDFEILSYPTFNGLQFMYSFSNTTTSFNPGVPTISNKNHYIGVSKVYVASTSLYVKTILTGLFLEEFLSGLKGK